MHELVSLGQVTVSGEYYWKQPHALLSGPFLSLYKALLSLPCWTKTRYALEQWQGCKLCVLSAACNSCEKAHVKVYPPRIAIAANRWGTTALELLLFPGRRP
jgi:hypothetical protein